MHIRAARFAAAAAVAATVLAASAGVAAPVVIVLPHDGFIATDLIDSLCDGAVTAPAYVCAQAASERPVLRPAPRPLDAAAAG